MRSSTPWALLLLLEPRREVVEAVHDVGHALHRRVLAGVGQLAGQLVAHVGEDLAEAVVCRVVAELLVGRAIAPAGGVAHRVAGRRPGTGLRLARRLAQLALDVAHARLDRGVARRRRAL